MQELQKQDSEYLEKIIAQNKEIISLLRKEVKDGREIERKSTEINRKDFR